MFRRKTVLAGLFVIAFTAIALFPTIALADNAQCLACHQSTMGTRPPQNFVVAPVNYGTACSKCHLDFAGSHPYHNTNSNCGALCHDSQTWGAALSANVPNYTANLGGGFKGGFASANSTSTDPALLHIIHSKPRWMEDKSFASSSCKSCHAMVACDACHEGAPDPTTHASHAATLSPSSTNNVSRGVLFGNQADPNGYTPLETTTCSAAICHNTSGVAAGSPSFKDDSVHIADPATGYLANPTVIKTGAWIVMKASAYTLGKTSSSNATGATLSVPFNGSQVALVADKDPYRGIAQILIDNVATGTVDLYNDTTVNQVEVWRSAKLASGDHTITVRVTGTKRLAPVASRGAYVRIDQFKIYTNAPGSVAPSCITTGCHPGYDSGHGGKKHALTIASSTYADGSGQGVETGCLSSGGGGCHDSLGASNVSTDIAGYHQTTQCATSACHTSASKSTHHEPFVCGDCHDSTYIGAVDTTALADLSPTGHYIDASHLATGGIAEVNTGGAAKETCSVCHDLSLKTAHTNIATPSKGTKVTCGECHNYSANVTTEIKIFKWTNGACSDCHNSTTMVISPQHANSVAVPVAATTSSGCASSGLNCHNTTDLHTIHKNAIGGCDLAGCHDATNKNIRPTKKSCGATGTCHTAYTALTAFPTHTISTEATNHAPLNTTQQTQSFLGNTCNDCHVVAKADGGLVTEHASATSTRTTNPGNVCLNCHNNAASTAAITSYWSSSETAGACTQCHTLALAVHADANAGAHTKTNTGCGASGPGCHNSGDLSQVGAVNTINTNIHSTCLRCHDRTGSATVPAPGGGNMKWNPANSTCGQGGTCHNTAGAVYATSGDPIHRSGQTSATTGNDIKHTADATYMTSHEDSGTAINICSDCHLGTLASEHATTGPAATPTKVGCTTGGYAGNNAGCHNTTTGAIALGSAAMVKNNWNGGTKTCVNCHTAKHNNIATVHTATSTQGCGASGAGCHTTYDLAALHKDRVGGGGCKLAGCHDASNKSQRPALKTCGSGGACHTAYTPTVGHRASTVTGSEAPTHTVTAASMAATEGVYSAGVYNDSRTCATCHFSAMVTEHSNTSSGTIGCATGNGGTGNTGCHNQSTPINSVNVIKNTNWQATRLCIDCHGTNGPAKHDKVVTGHDVGVGSCAGSGASCHTSTDLRIIHAKKTASYIGSVGCSNATDANSPFACHSTQGVVPTQKACGSGNSGCHTDKTTSNHGVKHTMVPASSAYADGATNDGVEAGCLSANAGCHSSLGTNNTSTDIAKYHQTTLCATSVCHTSASKSTHSQPFVCGDCHDSTYIGAIDTTALADVNTAGHYGVATHTATGGLGNVGVTGGTAVETCSVCHDLSLAPAHTNIVSTTKGTKVTCGECHGYNVSVISQIKIANWSTNSCVDCHVVEVMPLSVMHPSTVTTTVPATGSAGCASSGLNCHNTSDLHSIHRNAATGCDLAGCHDAAAKNNKPTKKSCGTAGTCHTTYTALTAFPTHTNSTETTDHAPTTTTQQTAVFLGNTCNACHVVAKADGGLVTEHGLSTSTMTVSPSNVCLNCHNNSSAAIASAIATGWGTPNNLKNGTGACATCHTGTLAAHADANTTAHADVTSSGCSSSGIGCHNSSDLSQVGAVTTVNTNIHSTCLRCHDRTATSPNLAYNPANDTCGSGRECHATAGLYDPSTSVHNGAIAGLSDGNDATHHQAGAIQMAGTYTYNSKSAACSACHTGVLGTEHARATSSLTGIGTNNCLKCHNDSATIAAVVKAGWANKNTLTGCSDCHANTDATSAATAHANAANHATGTTNAGCTALGAGCHGTAAIPDLTTVHTTGCALTRACHSPTVYNPTAKTCSNASCHPTANYNTTTYAHNAVNGTEATHTVTVGMTTTLQYGTGSASSTCATCHSSALKPAHNVAAGYATASLAWTNECTGCHNATTPINVAALVTAGTWTKSCLGNGCHTITQQAHVDGGTDAPAVTGVNSTTPACVGSGCHATLDLHELHKNAVGGCTLSDVNGACHTVAFLDKRPTQKTCGNTGGCHEGKQLVTHGYDPLKHESSDVAINGTAGYGFAGANSCYPCHYSNIYESTGAVAGEHKALGLTCTTCHGGTAPVSVDAIASGATIWNGSCQQCHTGAVGYASAVHGIAEGNLKTTNSATPLDASGFPATTTWNSTTNASAWAGHRARSGYRAFVTSWTTPQLKAAWNRGAMVNANTMNTNPRTGAAWAGTDDVYCTDCHEYVAQGGPHGAAVTVKLVTGYQWSATSVLTDATTLCSKCHKSTANVNSGHQKHGNGTGGVACWDCHVAIPHGYKRPALLLRADQDVAPLNRSPNGVNGLRAASLDAATKILVQTDGNVTSAVNTMCYAGCSSQHSKAGNKPTTWIDYGAAPALP